ncbi:hypothetical protein GS443_00625 [Rhodococcus hoagii]|nr:hypothetical protein [Prescottella equi]
MLTVGRALAALAAAHNEISDENPGEGDRASRMDVIHSLSVVCAALYNGVEPFAIAVWNAGQFASRKRLLNCGRAAVAPVAVADQIREHLAALSESLCRSSAWSAAAIAEPGCPG